MRKIILIMLISTVSLYAVHPTWETSGSIQELCEEWELFLDIDLQEGELIITDFSEDYLDIKDNIATLLFIIKDEVDYYGIELWELGIANIVYIWGATVRIISYDMILDYLELEKNRDKLQFTRELLPSLSIGQISQERK